MTGPDETTRPDLPIPPKWALDLQRDVNALGVLLGGTSAAIERLRLKLAQVEICALAKEAQICALSTVVEALVEDLKALRERAA